jgi:hypothetical protein
VTAPAPAPPPFVWREGDLEVARRALEETRSASVPPGPRLYDYLGDVMGAAIRAITRLIAAVFSGASGLGPYLQLAAIVLVAALVALAVVLIVRRVIERRRRSPGAQAAPRVEELSASAAPRDAAAWRRELEERLARGEVAGAIEALWWWLAETLTIGDRGGAAGRVDRSWTTRDMLDRARARSGGARVRGGDAALARMGVELDVLQYGRTRPSSADVRASVERFEKALG